MKLTLFTTTAHHTHLWDTANGTRKGAKACKVERDALMALLMDHGRLLDALGRDKWEEQS